MTNKNGGYIIIKNLKAMTKTDEFLVLKRVGDGASPVNDVFRFLSLPSRKYEKL